MHIDKRAKRLVFLENLTHYLTALVILLKGMDKMEAPGKTGYAVFFILIAVFIVLGTFFHHRLQHTVKHFKAYVFSLEAVVMSIVGYLYLKEGKQTIQYVCFAAALMFVVAVIVYFRKKRSGAHGHG